MARRRFFVEQIHSGAAEINGDAAEHLTRVLRVEIGQRYEISDNANIYVAEVEQARKKQVVFRVLEKVAPQPSTVRMILIPALFKFDRFEWMIEKATELGVELILPFTATRTERGLDRAAEKRVERWRKIGLEASQQCRRDRLPEIEDPTSVQSVVGRSFSYRLLLDEHSGGLPLLRALPAERHSDDTVAVVLGPEGGWTDDERGRFSFAGWQPVSLGPRILRAETAATAALSVIAAWWS
jgi:16S rRNA (uracil1498-N3)-methyltransferase